MNSLAAARLKRVRALELVAQGRSYDQIAQEVGYSHRGSAHKAVFKALDEREAEGVEELRRLEVDRLDAVQRALWTDALNGDLHAAKTIVTIISLRARLLGLLSARTADGPNRDAPAYLVVGPQEGNTGEATMQQIYQWSATATTKITPGT